MRRVLALALCSLLFAAACSGDPADGGHDVANVDAASPDAAAASPDAGSTPDTGSQGSSITDPQSEMVVLLEDLEVTIEEGESNRFIFDVPPDTQSIVVSIDGEPGEFYTLGQWINGDESDVVPNRWHANDQGAPALCLGCPNRIAASEASFAALLPNNQNTSVVPGQHQLSVYGFKRQGFQTVPISTTVTVRVVAEVLPAPPTQGVIDINLYFTGANGWTAEVAQNDPEFQGMLADVERLYEQVGLKLGELTYTDIDEEHRVIESTMLPKSDLQEMFALSADNEREAINVFVVEELLTGFGEFGVILGISGGIPGPPMSGTFRSGVAIATERTDEVTTELYKVFAHEVGHHLGLFHSSEQNLGGLQIHDQLDDTAENDDTNLMFYSGNGETLSEQQGAVMRLNPWIRHEEQP